MRTQHGFGTQCVMVLAALVLGCGGTMGTGTAKKPINNKPAADGTCPDQRSLCGTGKFAICTDMQSDPNHCGACDRVCSPGIACQAGVCQQTVCTGTAIPLSGQPTTSVTPPGTFSWPKQILADVNGDGHLDLIEWLSQYTDEDLSAFRASLGQPGGGFATSETYRASANVLEIVAMDVNDDGFEDLYVLASAVDTHAVFSPYRVELWLGHGDGHLTRSDTAGGSGPALTTAVAFADLSGDGWPDLVMMTPDAPNSGQPSGLDVYLSDSTGALHLSKSYVTGWGSIGRTVIWDWNGDGSPDIAEIQNSMQILYNRGDGTFEPPVDCAIGGIGTVVLGDFNRDGRMDLAFEGWTSNRIGVMLGFGGCGFSPVTYYAPSGYSTAALRGADMNGDGIIDIVSIRAQYAPDANGPGGPSTAVEDNLLTVLLGKGDGTFQPSDQVISLGPGATSDVAIGEVSGDQRPDVVIAGLDGPPRIWENTCQGRP